MTQDVSKELHRGLPLKEGRLEYTRRAFHMLPKMDRPRILDVGCGRGDPTLELARLSGGHVTGVDIDQISLDELTRSANEEGLSERVKAVRMDVRELDLPEASFDLVWAEYSMWIMGFETGLRDLRRMLVPDGFFVVHEMCWLRPDPPEEMRDKWEFVGPGIRTVEEDLEILEHCGLSPIGHFTLPKNAWWDLYFKPMASRIPALRERHADDPEALAFLEKERADMDIYRRNSDRYGSAFFVLQSTGGQAATG